MIDMIVYCPDIQALTAELCANFPQYIDIDPDNGDVTFLVTKTPIVRNGNESLSLLRVSDQWALDPFEHLQVLAQAPAGGSAAFDVLFADPAATAIYDRVYNQSPVTFTDEFGEQTHTPPRMFGVFA